MTSQDDGNEVGFAVYPVSECPHCPSVADVKEGMVFDLKAPCAVCGNVGENMMCLSCLEVHCGRHVEGHMVSHHEKSSHPMVIGFADLAVWCYPCETYVDGTNKDIAPFHGGFYKAKFGEEDIAGKKKATPAAAASGGGSTWDESNTTSGETKLTKEQTAELDAPLAALRRKMDKTSLSVLPVHNSHYNSGESRRLVNYTCLFEGALNLCKPAKADGANAATAPAPVKWQDVVLGHARRSRVTNRALGCMMGMAVGDSVGAPMEFLPVDSSLPPYKQKTSRKDTGRVSYLDSTKLDEKGNFIYVEEFNKFRLHRGQWTDDTSMGLAMAESMLTLGHYNGADIRVRFYLWWYFGYCNAFRYDKDQTRTSVGLGGNISKSLDDLFNYRNKSAKDVPEVYLSHGEDAGNGSIMRLAAIPIRFQFDEDKGMATAASSSYTTHPGPDAASCCRFLSFFCIRAMRRDDDSTDVAAFLDTTIKAFIAKDLASSPQQSATSAAGKLLALLQSRPPSPKEACWDWKADRIQLEETVAARGRSYNGFPVMAGYFGSYCMDGLAMALWALSHSANFVDAILKIVNLLGDCDTTGAIAGQMAGAFYGYEQGLFQSGPMGAKMLSDIRRWDPMCEIELRALLLLQDGEQEGELQLD